MKETLKICLVQTEPYWEDKINSTLQIEKMLLKTRGEMDIIILPEMFNTGFTTHSPHIAESNDSSTLEWMRKTAARYNAVVTGSLLFEENNRIFNRLIWMNPVGTYDYYNKRHLFKIGGEADIFQKGNSRLITEYHGWRICPLICYDLRFPVWSRNADNYDLLIYVSNWPESRRIVWDTLLKARAIENQAYVCGVNRVGTDGENIKYNGGSVMIDPRGNEIYKAKNKNKEAGICEISLPLLKKFREKFPVLPDRDEFNIII